MENFKKITKQQSPARTIAFGFAVLIFIGAALLSLPIAVRGAVQLPGLDALFTATSAVCVTGLVTVDPGDTFTLFGQAVLAVLMQLGGLGISSVSMGLAIAAGRRISFRGRSLVREALNVESFGGMVKTGAVHYGHDSAGGGHRRGGRLPGVCPGLFAAACRLDQRVARDGFL